MKVLRELFLCWWGLTKLIVVILVYGAPLILFLTVLLTGILLLSAKP